MDPRPKILVVDDEPNIVDSFRFILEDDYEIDGAYSGEEALEKVKTHDYDLVILDIILPGINGVKVLKEIKKINSSLEVIMLTATQSVKTAVDSMKLGAFDYFTKPFDNDEIIKVIKKIIKKNRCIKELNTIRLKYNSS